MTLLTIRQKQKLILWIVGIFLFVGVINGLALNHPWLWAICVLIIVLAVWANGKRVRNRSTRRRARYACCV